MLQNKLDSLYSLHMSTAKGSLSRLDKVLVPCFDARAHVPALDVSSDVNLLPVRFSGAAGSFSSSSSHLCSNAAAPPIPPPPTLLSDTHLQEGIHLHAGAHLNDGWRMSNTALLFFSPFHKMLTDAMKISLFETLSYFPFSSSSPSTSTHPSPRSFLYIYAGTFFKLWRLTLEKMRQWCLCKHQGVASERGTFFLFKK